MDMSSSSSPPSTETSLYLHAELLPNIRQITLYVSLSPNPALHGLRPAIQLSESRKAVTVSLPHPFTHITETIKLPARVSETSRQTLITNTHTTQQPNHDYSFRMPIDPTDAALTPQDELTDDYVPWTAADMTSATRIRCRVCSAELLNTPAPSQDSQNGNADSGQVWKDLPSGNWAEMMDFWHCHKPDPHEENPEAGAALKVEEQNAQVKGYGASSRVVAIAGTVLVDTATFLLAEEDCGGLIKTNEDAEPTSNGLKQRSINCADCNAVIGTEDPTVNGWRLLKANVSLATTANPEIQSVSAEVIIAAQLLELIERESARRFVVHRGSKDGLLLWVFNPDLRYSNVGTGHAVNNQQAMKVLYQTLDDVDTILNRDMGRPSPLSVEELELPPAIFNALSDALHGSTKIIPFTARRFNEWQVGLLHRFSRREGH